MKKFLSILLVFLLCFSSFAFASCETSHAEIQTRRVESGMSIFTINTGNRKNVDVRVPLSLSKLLTEDDIISLAYDYRQDPTVTAINIIDVGYQNTADLQTFSAYATASSGIKTEKKYDMSKGAKKKYAAKDYFITSVAKGETITLKKSVSGSLSLEVSGSFWDKAALKLKGSISTTIEAGKTYQGPPESSTANSREYRLRFYSYHGTFRQYKVDSQNQPYDVKNGSFKEPASWASYSVDHKI